MSTSTVEISTALARHVTVTDDSLTMDLMDGRTITAPLVWYPRLLHATAQERDHWRLIGNGEGVHWPDLDEDISVENVLVGRPSTESQRSFKQWLDQRSNPARMMQEDRP